MAGKLSKRRIDAAKPGKTIWDGEIAGFGLRVSKSGVKSYVLKYRRSGVQRWLTLGRHGAPFTPATARKAAQHLIGQIAAGNDPAYERARNRDAESLEVFAERYLIEFSAVHKKASTARNEAGLLKTTINPALGKLRLKDIQRADIARLHRSLKDKPYLANRCLALLSHMFNIAQDWGVRPEGTNPCSRVKRYPEPARERFLAPAELKRLGKTLEDAENRGESIYVINAIRLLIFTGARLDEILSLQWTDVDLNARLIRLADSKTGKKTIALAAPAADLLSTLPKMKGNPFVICGRNEGAHLVNLQKPWRRIRANAKFDDVRLNDLRHSFASVAVSGGMSLPLIGSLLGHTQPQTTARYAHLADDPRQAAADRIAASIDASMRGVNAKVTPIRERLK